MDWNTKTVLQMADIPLEDADEYLIAVAETAIERCYYLDRAAEYVLEVLDACPRRKRS